MEAVLVGVLSALGGGGLILGLLKLRPEKESLIVKTAQEFAESTTRTAVELVNPLRAEMAALRERMVRVEKDNEHLEAAHLNCEARSVVQQQEIDELRGQLHAYRSTDR